MPVGVRQDSTAPSSANNPDGTATFPLAVAAKPMPVGATALANSSGNVAAASAVATLTSVAARTAHISGFEMTGGGATAGSLVIATVIGLLGGTLTYIFAVPAGVTIGATPLAVAFDPALPASDLNVNIVVTLPSLGAGNTNAAVVAHGYLI